jgi:hypothetical protein
METPLLSDEPSSKLLNLLLIDNVITDYQTLVDSVNESTLTIVYSYSMTKTELISEINKNFITISRIGIICHSNGTEITTFLDNQPFFLDSEISPYSENLQFLIDAIKEFNVKNIDFLACNTLNYSNWKNNYEILTKETGVIVGASDDPTGNIKYGGDWIMENTNEDIENIYFKINIQYYKYLFVIFNSTISNVTYTFDTVIPTNADNVGVSFNANTTAYYGKSSYPSSAGYNRGQFYITGTWADTISPPDTVNYGTTNYTVRGIHQYAFWRQFQGSSTKKITFSDKVVLVGQYAFMDSTGITNVTFNGDIKSIGTYAFKGCTNLNSITFSTTPTFPTVPMFCFQGCSALTSLQIPSTVTSFQQNAFSSCTSLTAIPSLNNINFIGGYAFEDCSGLTVKAINIPTNVTSVHAGAFRNTNITSVVFNPGSAVTSISDAAFQGCTFLTSFTLSSNSITSIGASAFQGCTSLTALPSLTNINVFGASAFNGCNGLTVREINIPTNVTGFLTGAFKGTNIISVVFNPGSAVTFIPDTAFQGCTFLTSFRLSSNSITSIGASAFQGCTSLTALPSLTTVKTVGDNAFEGCISLTSITLSDSIMSLGNSAFNGCTNLTSVLFLHNVTTALPTFGTTVFGNNKLAPIIAFYTFGVPNPMALVTTAGFADARIKTGGRYNSQ